MTWLWLIVGACIITALVLVLALCKVASDADEQEDDPVSLWDLACDFDWRKFDEQLNDIVTPSNGYSEQECEDYLNAREDDNT